MREHVMSEVDTNRDTAISLGEFTAYTQTNEFSNPSNDYVMIDEQIARGELYTALELQEYRQVVRVFTTTQGYRLGTLGVVCEPLEMFMKNINHYFLKP